MAGPACLGAAFSAGVSGGMCAQGHGSSSAHGRKPLRHAVPGSLGRSWSHQGHGVWRQAQALCVAWPGMRGGSVSVGRADLVFSRSVEAGRRKPARDGARARVGAGQQARPRLEALPQANDSGLLQPHDAHQLEGVLFVAWFADALADLAHEVFFIGDLGPVHPFPLG